MSVEQFNEYEQYMVGNGLLESEFGSEILIKHLQVSETHLEEKIINMSLIEYIIR
jgi:hypothetical protein